MVRPSRLIWPAAYAAFLWVGPGGSNRSVSAQGLPLVRDLGPVVGVTQSLLSSVSGLREFDDGRVLVNDASARRVVVLDSALKVVKTVLDTSSGARFRYVRPLILVSGRAGDSTLLIDPVSLSVLAINRNGELAGLTAIPRPQDVAAIQNVESGRPGIDSRGRLVYRLAPSQASRPTPGVSRTALADSAAVVGVEWSGRRMDTLAVVKVRARVPVVAPGVTGGSIVGTRIDPIVLLDEWVVTANGEIAVLRGGDLHIDWVRADGTRAATAKLPYEWRRLTDSAKAAIVDSARRVSEAHPLRGAEIGNGTNIIAAIAPVMASDSLPDYRAPFAPQTTWADANGNVWVLPVPQAPSVEGAVYYVVNPAGEVVDRVRIPGGMRIAGFGRNSVYLASRETAGGASGLALIRRRLR